MELKNTQCGIRNLDLNMDIWAINQGIKYVSFIINHLINRQSPFLNFCDILYNYWMYDTIIQPMNWSSLGAMDYLKMKN